MAGTGSNKISVNADEAMNALRKVSTAQNSAGLPNEASIVVTAPPSVSVVVPFNSGMSSYAYELKRKVAALREQLLEVHEDIKATVTQFAERDASVSDEAAALLSSIAPLPVIGTPASTPAVPAAGSPTTGLG